MPPGRVADCTAGDGGHTAILLDLGHEVVAFDRDPKAIEQLRSRFGDSTEGLTIIQERFSSIDEFGELDGVLADFGFSSRQIADESRGFSFKAAGPPDMRMDPQEEETAASLIKSLGERRLEEILRTLGEERRARQIARAITGKTFESSFDLGEAISAAVGGRKGPIHPATKSFQALRIFVNSELGEIQTLLDKIPSLIRPGGRVALIAFHSLEDRLVKNASALWEGRCICPPELPICVCNAKRIARPLWKGVKRAEEKEVRQNPRARSAVMRAIEFTDDV